MKESRLRCFNKILWLKECKILLLSHVAVLREVVRMVRIVQLWVVIQAAGFLASMGLSSPRVFPSSV